MNKKQIRIEALEIAGGLLTSCECTMWSEKDEKNISPEDQGRVVNELIRMGFIHYRRATYLKGNI